MTERTSQFYPRVFGLVTALLLGVSLFQILQPFLGPLLWAGLLAFILFPVNQALRRVLRGRKGTAAVLLSLAVVLVIVIPAALLLGIFVAQASDLVTRWQAAAVRHQIVQAGDLLRIPVIDGGVRWIGTMLPITAEHAQDWIVQGGKQLLQTLISLMGSLFAGALGAFIGVILALFLFFFFLRDGEEMVERALFLIPMEDQRKTQLVGHLAAVTKAVVLGSLFTAIVQGTLVGAGFAVVRLPSPIVFGVLGVGAALVPLVGTAMVWGPAAVILAAQGRWGAAAFLAIWGAVVISSADNFVRPLVISGRAQISTLPVFIGLLGGISAFGAIGMFLGPVLIALALALIRFAEESRGKSVSPGP
jgi:predicted PurR-regulated permease PerM